MIAKHEEALKLLRRAVRIHSANSRRKDASTNAERGLESVQVLQARMQALEESIALLARDASKKREVRDDI